MKTPPSVLSWSETAPAASPYRLTEDGWCALPSSASERNQTLSFELRAAARDGDGRQPRPALDGVRQRTSEPVCCYEQLAHKQHARHAADKLNGDAECEYRLEQRGPLNRSGVCKLTEPLLEQEGRGRYTGPPPGRRRPERPVSKPCHDSAKHCRADERRAEADQAPCVTHVPVAGACQQCRPRMRIGLLNPMDEHVAGMLGDHQRGQQQRPGMS
jgi:hypothetical protein